MAIRFVATTLALSSALIAAQTSKYDWAKTPIKSGDFVHLQDGLAPVFIHPSHVSASGVWVDTERKNPPAGPSVSDITCERSEDTCEESQANIVGFHDGTFTVTADHAEYHIDRWNEEEIVAKGDPAGICKVLNVLRIDLKLKKVYAFQTLSEPLNEHLSKLSKDICSAVGSNWELHQSTPFSMSPEAKTLVDKR